ncbi:MAG TPA: T9SS type A sorting domain-containing protein [Segetibacter sp.]|jgi:hypothetical protein
MTPLHPRTKFVISILTGILCLNIIATAQVYNNGSTIRIVDGGFFMSTGTFSNASGNVINDGKLEVQGSFINNSTYNSTTGNDSLYLTGAGASLLNSGLSPLYYLQVNKLNGGGITLSGNTLVQSRFDLLAGDFSTNLQSTYELTAPVTTIFSFAQGAEISGKVRRTNWRNDNAIIFHQPNMVIKTTGGIAPTSLLVNMIPGGDPTLAEKEVKRYFYFSPVGGSSYFADVSFPYKSAELNSNTQSTLAPWYYSQSSNKWNIRAISITSNIGLQNVSARGLSANIFSNTEWKLAEAEYDKRNQNLFVYPVPARNNISIVLVSQQNNKATIKLFDASGKLCRLTQADVLRGINNLSLNLTGLSAGQYTLRIEEVNGAQSMSILVL